MKRMPINRLITLLTVLILAVASGFAREFGQDVKQNPLKYEVSSGKKLNVRATASTDGSLVYQLKPGDVVYFDAENPSVANDGHIWRPITDSWGGSKLKTAYVADSPRFVPTHNSQYAPPTAAQINMNRKVKSSQTVAKWILLVLCVLGSIFLCVSYYFMLTQDGKRSANEFWLGDRRNNMRRTFFFNAAPYRNILWFTACFLVAAVLSVLVLVAVGGVVFGVLWLVKILCYVLMWAGIIGCIIGIVMTVFTGEKSLGIVLAIIGGVIWYFSDSITDFGEACADTGLNFFNEFNILAFAWQLVKDYWLPALEIIAIPLALFVGLGAIWLAIAGALMGFEAIMTHYYSVKHPCPHCQQPSEPAIYLSKNTPIPNEIKLRPGPYGLFHIKHPDTKEKMPTMILNGRDKLPRKCRNCGHTIQAEEGTEKHIALVGSPQSGKSTLTYRMLAEIFREAPDRIKFTDNTRSIKIREMEKKVRSIAREQQISDYNLPSKTTTGDITSKQVMIDAKNQAMPFRLFINDVAGELYTAGTQQDHRKTRYFQNVDSIIFVIDPLTTDLSQYETGNGFNLWLNKRSDVLELQKTALDDLKDSISNQLEIVNKDRKKVDINFVLVKKDLGYIGSHGEEMTKEYLQDYIENELGLGSLISWAKGFASYNIHAVSATAKGQDSNVDALVKEVVTNQLGIKYS